MIQLINQLTFNPNMFAIYAKQKNDFYLKPLIIKRVEIEANFLFTLKENLFNNFGLYNFESKVLNNALNNQCDLGVKLFRVS